MGSKFVRLALSQDLLTALTKKLEEGGIPDEELRYQVELGRFNKVHLNQWKLEDLAVVTSISLLVKMMSKHQLSTAIIGQIPFLLSNPQKLFKSATVDNSLVVLTLEVKGANLPLVLPFKPNTPSATGKPNMHWVTSFYLKEDVSAIKEWEKNNLLIWKV